MISETAARYVAAGAVSPFRGWNRLDLEIDPGRPRVRPEVDDDGALLGYRFAVIRYGAFRSRLRGIEPRLLDSLIIAVGAWQQVWLWTAPRPGPRVVIVPAGLLFVCALLARDRWPLGARLASFAALAVWAGYAPHSHGSTISYFVGVLLAFWVAGAAAEPRDAVLAWVAGCALVAYATSVFPGGSIGDFFFSMLILSGLWLGAFTVGRRTQRARSLQQRLTQEQSEREARARRAVAEERTRIARELHDVVAHSLSVAVIQTVAAAGELPACEREGQVGHRLQAIESSCRDALARADGPMGLGPKIREVRRAEAANRSRQWSRSPSTNLIAGSGQGSSRDYRSTVRSRSSPPAPVPASDSGCTRGRQD